MSRVFRHLWREISSSSIRANPDIQDLAVQDSIRSDWFQPLSEVVVKEGLGGCYGRNRPARDLRIAFYLGEVDTVRAYLRDKNRDPNIKLLNPFSRDIFDRLDLLLREMYLTDIVPRLIMNPGGNSEVLAAFDELTDGQVSTDNDFLGAWLDLAVAVISHDVCRSTERSLPVTAADAPGRLLCQLAADRRGHVPKRP